MERLPEPGRKGARDGRLPQARSSKPAERVVKPIGAQPGGLSGTQADQTGRPILTDWKGTFVGAPTLGSNVEAKEQHKALDGLFSEPLAPAGVAPLPPAPVFELTWPYVMPEAAPAALGGKEPLPDLPAPGEAVVDVHATVAQVPERAPKRIAIPPAEAPAVIRTELSGRQAAARPIGLTLQGPPHLRLPRPAQARQSLVDPVAEHEHREGLEMRLFAVELAKILLVSHDRIGPRRGWQTGMMRGFAYSLAGIFMLVFLGSAISVTLPSAIPPEALVDDGLPTGSRSILFGAASGPQDPMVVCHKPGTPAEKNLTLPETARGHGGHGDEESSCEGDEGSGSGGEAKTEVCHVTPRGNHTLTIAVSAVPAHLANGDALGACPDEGSGGGGGDDKVDVCHVAPGGNRTLTIALAALAAHLSRGDTLGACPDDERPDDKVEVCHDGHTIEVAGSAVAAHLAHGDSSGACDGGGAGGGGGGNKTTVCHEGNPLEVAESAVAAHLAHGDTRGACEGGGDNLAPTAAFSHHCVHLVCSFDGSSSSDADGFIVNWTWIVNSTLYGPGATFTFPASGSYDVSLIVSDDEGATDNEVRTISVSSAGGGGGGGGGGGSSQSTPSRPSDQSTPPADSGPGSSGASSGNGGSGEGSSQGEASSSGSPPSRGPGFVTLGFDVSLLATSGGRSRRRHRAGQDAPDDEDEDVNDPAA